MKRWLSILLAVGFAGEILAADAAADFSAANKLYAEGKFSDAANAYGQILSSGASSANLLFNFGNAEFKSGNLGKSIAAFRRAELLAPHDSEVRANLNFVRNQVQGSTVHESRWQSSLDNFSLNEWTAFAAIAFWLTFILLATRQIRPTLAPKLRGMTNVLILLTVLLISISAVQAACHFSKQGAVVISNEATARSGPFDDAQNSFTVRDGVELSVLAQREDWVQVADGSGRIGWLNKKQIEILPGA
jgi:tetratricopeptide (TPR) repeat protein